MLNTLPKLQSSPIFIESSFDENIAAVNDLVTSSAGLATISTIGSKFLGSKIVMTAPMALVGAFAIQVGIKALLLGAEGKNINLSEIAVEAATNTAMIAASMVFFGAAGSVSHNLISKYTLSPLRAAMLRGTITGLVNTGFSTFGDNISGHHTKGLDLVYAFGWGFWSGATEQAIFGMKGTHALSAAINITRNFGEDAGRAYRDTGNITTADLIRVGGNSLRDGISAHYSQKRESASQPSFFEKHNAEMLQGAAMSLAPLSFLAAGHEPHGVIQSASTALGLIFFPFAIRHETLGAQFTRAVEDYVAMPNPQPGDARQLANLFVNTIAANQGHAAFDVLNRNLSAVHLDPTSQHPLWPDIDGVVSQAVSSHRFGRTVRDIAEPSSALLQAAENSHFAPVLRAMALQCIDEIVFHNWDNIVQTGDQQLIDQTVNCLVRCCTYSGKYLPPMAASILANCSSLFLQATQRFEEYPIPPIAITEIVRTNLERLTFIGETGIPALRNVSLGLIHILRANIRMMTNALDGNESPHADLNQIWARHKSLINTFYRPIMELYGAILENEVHAADEAFQSEHQVVWEGMQAIGKHGQQYGDPIMPTVPDGGFMQLDSNARVRIVHALNFRLLTECREIDPELNPYRFMYLDGHVLHQLGQVLAPQHRQTLTPWQSGQVENFIRALDEPSPLALTHTIQDERDSLNILCQPQVFCELVRTRPDELVRLRRWLLLLSVDARVTARRLPISEDAEGLLALTDFSLDLYRLFVGPLPEVIAADRANPRADYMRRRLGPSPESIQHYAHQFSQLGQREQGTAVGNCGVMLQALPKLLHSRLNENARATMDVVEAHLEGLVALYHPRSQTPFDMEDPLPFELREAYFRQLVLDIDNYANALQRHGAADYAEPEANHYRALARRYRKLYQLPNIPAPTPRTPGRGGGNTGGIPEA